MSKSNQKGRKGRLQDFVTQYLWNEEFAKDDRFKQIARRVAQLTNSSVTNFL